MNGFCLVCLFVCWGVVVCLFFGGAESLLLHIGLVPHGLWNPPRPGIEPSFPALAGGTLNHWTTREVCVNDLSRGSTQSNFGFIRIPQVDTYFECF